MKNREKHLENKEKHLKEQDNKQERLQEKLQKMKPEEQNGQVYDSAFKTMEIRIPRFTIPVINEMFGTEYSPDDEIELLYGEETGLYPAFRIRNRRTDSKMRVREMQYHLECESTVNGDIAIRMFEYDWMEAAGRVKKKKGEYVIRIQNSGILYLRSNSRTPEAFQYRIIFPDGAETVYQIPIMKNMDYSLEDIFQKKLHMLLPFYFLHYEKWVEEIGKIEHEKQAAGLPAKEAADTQEAKKVMDMLESDLKMIYNGLNKDVRQAVISDYEAGLLMQLVWDISDRVFCKSKTMKERMGKLMGGQILEYEWETEYRMQINEARDEGRNEGRIEGENRGFVLRLISQICQKLKKNKTPDVIAEELEEDLESVEQICRAAEEFAPDYDVEKIYNAM